MLRSPLKLIKILLGIFSLSVVAIGIGFVAFIRMGGIILSPPEILNLVAGMPAALETKTIYTGNGMLSYSLEKNPEGMQIDFSSGTIRWTPPESAEGNRFDITVKTTDGEHFAETSFSVSVARTTPLQSKIEGNTLTITEEGSNLNGLVIEAPDGNVPLGDIQLEHLPEDSIPQAPLSPRITDFFVVKTPVPERIKVRLPLSQLPAGADLNHVRLYRYHTAGEALDLPVPFWGTTLLDYEISGNTDDPVVIITLPQIGGMYFVGIEEYEPAGE